MKRSSSITAQRPSVIKNRTFWLLVIALIGIAASGVDVPHRTSHSRSQPLDECRPPWNAAKLTASPCYVPCVSIQNCPAGQNVPEGATVKLSTSVPPGLTPKYNWTLKDSEGQDRSDSLDSRDKGEVRIDTNALRGGHTATIEVTGFDSPCSPRADSCAFTIVSIPPPCPTISVDCPEAVEQGETINFTASVTGAEPLAYNWSVSAGLITAGQGTSTLTVDTSNLPAGSSVQATLSIGGRDPSCQSMTQCTTLIRRPKVFKFDEYSGDAREEENQRLDKYASALLDNPAERGFIVAAGTCAGEGQARADRIKAYLVNSKRINASRLSISAESCRKEPRVQLWLMGQGTPLPKVDTKGDVVCPKCLQRPRRGN